MTRETLTIDGTQIDLEAAPLLMDIRNATDIKILGVDVYTHEDDDRYIKGGGTVTCVFETSEDAEQFIDILVQTDTNMLERYSTFTMSDRGDWGTTIQGTRIDMPCGHEHIGLVVMICFPLFYLKTIPFNIHKVLYPNGIEGDPDNGID